MTDNVIPLTVVPGDNYHAEADAILDQAKGKLRTCVLIGWDNDGNLYARQTDSDAETNMLLDLGKRALIEAFFED